MSDQLTMRGALALVGHEAVVPEAYLDSEDVWTWGVGVTDASGHHVGRYKDNPQPMSKCLAVYLWLLREKYVPAVEHAFPGRTLSEAQFAAALSFHYNTGAIGKTSWVDLFRQGRVREARTFLTTHYLNGGRLKSRRGAEAALFFDGVWPTIGTTLVYDVAKPSYRPIHPRRVDISADMGEAFANG